jgi:riboflavin biosynthesis pyrimidine reductase
MKRIRYGVAMSLDGYIAGPNGEADWIVSDPEVNFAENLGTV